MAISKNRRQALRERAQRSTRNRRAFVEQLEARCLMAADWQNATMPMDVNADQAVTPLDALQVVIKLNADGSGPLPSLGAGVHPSAYYDTNGDGFVTPLDALLVLKTLNLNSPTSAADSVQPLTVDIVPVNATTFLATYSQPMGASASDPANYTITADDGTNLQVRQAVKAQGESVFELHTAPQTSSSSTGYTVNIQNVAAQSGQTVFFEGRKLLTGNPKGAVVSVAATSSTRVVVVFNEAMADNALAPQHYLIKDAAGNPLLVTDAQFDGPLGMVVILTTVPQAKVLYQLNVSVVTDLQNDGLEVKTGTFTGIAAPRLLNAIPTLPTRLVLTFSGPVGDSALSPSTYAIEELTAAGIPTGNRLPITQARFLGDQRTIVELVTASQSGSRYRLTPTNLTDVAGSSIPGNAVPFQGIAGFPQLVGITPSGSNSLLLTFSEPMSDDALSPTSYVIKDAAGVTLQILNAQFIGTERRLVQLFTGPQLPGTYTFQTITATDIGGNQATLPAGSTGVFQGVPAPSLGSATPTDSTHIILTFGSAVGDSALSPSAYKIDKLDGAGNVIGSLPLNSATFVGGQRTVVSLVTAEQSNATYRISTTIALTDAAGMPLPVVQINFAGIASAPPALVGATSTGPTTMLFTFSLPMSDDALSPTAYVINDASGSPLQVLSAKFVGTERRIVELTTVPQTGQNYTIVSINATSTGGETTIVPAIPSINIIPGNVTPSEATPVDGPPRVVGAASLGNTTVLVAFSEPMADNVLNPSHYFIVQQNINPEVGFVPVLSAVFNSPDRRSVLLTTASQNELTYAVTAVNVTDLAGNALGPAVIAGSQRVDPTTAQFPGTPPSGTQIVDTDGDGLSDNIEVRGWTVTVALLNGQTISRQVTSDPNNVDADGDGLWDAQELNIGIDPRSADTDGDQLNDWAEFNEIYSDPTNQDSDGDSLDDFLEFAFFKTSAVFADSDGDQINDGDEILGNRNARVSDLPRPEIEVGAINLQLDVRFSESNARESRDLETRSITSTLAQSESRTLTRQFTGTVEAHLGNEVGAGDGTKDVGAYNRTSFDITAGFTFQQTDESASETQRSYENSFSTEQEVSSGFTVERQVVGAVMQATVNLRNVSNLAYRVKNLQVTAFIQDPQDRTQLTPVATLLPDNEPEEGFTLGPFVTNRGPLVFSNDTIVPSLVESLMANSSGLIFRISNYDIINEDGRNFAFISQDVVERTGQLVIDFGGARSLRARVSGETIDENQPGDETEIHRVSTSAGQVIDTNFDGVVDEDDRYATFDGVGKEVGITLFEALAAVGLEQYEARLDPLTGRYVEYVPGEATPVDVSTPNEDDRILGSYSTFVDELGRERIFRIRGVANDLIIQKYWEILTPLGIDQQSELSELVLKTNSPISLNFVQDLDGDLLPADVEFLLRTSDTPLPFGANVPGSTDTASETVRFNTDPGLSTGTLVRVSADRGGLIAGTDYFFRNLGGGTYRFYNTAANANAGTATGRIDLTSNVSAGVFRPNTPSTTNTTAESVSFDPGLATGTPVRVIATSGSLLAGTNYYLRNLGGSSYAFYDSAANASSGTAAGRIDLTSNIAAGLFNPASPSVVYYPSFTDFVSRSITFDPRFASATVVNVTQNTGGLTAGEDYYLRPLGGGSYNFYDSAANALGGTNTGRIDLTGNITAGVFSPTAHGRDTDRDGLDDRFEALIGWTVSTPLRTYTAYSSPNRRDSNFDNPKPGVDSDLDLVDDRLEFDGSDGNVGPAGWDDKNSNRLRDRFETFRIDINDLVLDPIRKDTDEDGINDAAEIIGFRITPIDAPGTTKLIASTDPTNPFTDSDTFTDGFERLVGLDPTDGSDTDEDGDGLPDRVEIISGWIVRTYGLSTSPFVQGTPTVVVRYSRIDSVDSDEDGLTDYEEFFLKTNALAKDTDGDGIEDRIEYLGYDLGHEVAGKDIGIITTDPLDADTDNDKRSDGAEAELVDIELNAWVVRVKGATPYRVYSHPLKADADFDGLVDGDEFYLDPAFPTRHSDPNNGNTDGDTRDDGVERGASNPLAVDIRATVVLESVEISAEGQYEYQVNVRPPGTGVAGLSNTPVLVFESESPTSGVGRVRVHNTGAYVAKISFYYYNASGVLVQTGEGGDHLAGQTIDYNPGDFGVPLNATFFANMRAVAGGSNLATEAFVYTTSEAYARYTSGGTTLINRSFTYNGIAAPVDLPQDDVPLASRSAAFGLANDERFSVEGFFRIVTPSGITTLNLGGLEGKKASKDTFTESTSTTTATLERSVFSYIQVADKFIEDYYYEFTVEGVTVKISFYYIVG